MAAGVVCDDVVAVEAVVVLAVAVVVVVVAVVDVVDVVVVVEMNEKRSGSFREWKFLISFSLFLFLYREGAGDEGHRGARPQHGQGQVQGSVRRKIKVRLSSPMTYFVLQLRSLSSQ